jgi:hypothetical protein
MKPGAQAGVPIMVRVAVQILYVALLLGVVSLAILEGGRPRAGEAPSRATRASRRPPAPPVNT